jgi:hypothetical protein
MKRWLVLMYVGVLVLFGSSASAQFGIKLEGFGAITENLRYQVSVHPHLTGSLGVLLEARLESASELSFGGPFYLALIGSPFVTGVYQPNAGPNFALVGLEGVARMGFRGPDFELNFDLAFAPGLILQNGAVSYRQQLRAGMNVGNDFFQFDFDIGTTYDIISLRTSIVFTVTPWLRIGVGYWSYSGAGGGGG